MRKTLLFVCLCMALLSCTKNRTDEPATTPVAVIYDTDLGSSTDDLFALEMLYRYHEEGRCRLLGVVVDREGEDCAAVADVMNTYFGHGDLPIGLVQEGIDTPYVWIDYRNMASWCGDGGSPMFDRTNMPPYPDGWQLYRRLLAAEPDHSVAIVSVGFVTCLAQLLESKGDEYSPLSGVELVRQKVKCLYVQGGSFGDTLGTCYNLVVGPDFAQTFFRLWPTDVDIVFSPGEVGDIIEYVPDTVIADIDWTDIHPVKQVYLRCNTHTGQMMWDPLSVIGAVEGDGLFSLSERGTVSLTPGAETVFTPSPAGNCRYQLPGDSAWNAMMLDKIRTVNRMH